MKNFSETLRQKHLKNTPLRVAILEVLSTASSPLSIAHIEGKLQEKNISYNLTSLYRQMESLVIFGLVQSIILSNSVAHFEMQVHHHHHFVCDGCSAILCLEDAEFEDSIHQLEKKLKVKGFSITSHQFSFHGKCHQCV